MPLNQFETDLITGLSKKEKSIPSKYFYDEIGSQLFTEITKLPEYYLSKAETEIFQSSEQITQHLEPTKQQGFDLIELGAGDGVKSTLLIKELISQDYAFDYHPIDISSDSLIGLRLSLILQFPSLNIHIYPGEFLEQLREIGNPARPKIVLFLGSTLGNLNDDEAAILMRKIGQALSIGDKMILGVDLIKPASIVLPAYSDAKKVTAQFNLNLLSRANKELCTNFNLECFEHVAEYEESVGIARSFLRSKKDHVVKSCKHDVHLTFTKGELIHTEISRKYNDSIIEQILNDSGLVIQNKITDRKGWFADYILKKE